MPHCTDTDHEESRPVAALRGIVHRRTITTVGELGEHIDNPSLSETLVAYIKGLPEHENTTFAATDVIRWPVKIYQQLRVRLSPCRTTSERPIHAIRCTAGLAFRGGAERKDWAWIYPSDKPTTDRGIGQVDAFLDLNVPGVRHPLRLVLARMASCHDRGSSRTGGLVCVSLGDTQEIFDITSVMASAHMIGDYYHPGRYFVNTKVDHWTFDRFG